MARTNTNQDRTGRQARPAQANEPPLPWHSAPQGNYGPQEPQFAPTNGYDVPPTQRPHMPAPQAQMPWPQTGNGYPPQPQAPQYLPQQHQPYPQPQYQQQPYQQPAPYQNEGHYYGASQDPQHGYASAQPHHGYPQQADQGYPQQQPYPAQYHAPAADPRGYDLGAYSTAPAGYADVPPTRPQAPYPQQGYASSEFGAPNQHYGQQGQRNLAPHQGDEFHEDDDYEEDEDDDLDPPRRFRFLKILASLVIAIGIGAGGAYTYKKYGLSPTSGNRPILARADAPPVRGQSGLDQSSTDTKSGDRLNTQIPAVVPANDGASDSDAPTGPRRVQTIPIGPPTVGQQPTQAQQPPMRPTISVPGVALDGMAGVPAQQATPPTTPTPLTRSIGTPVPAQQQKAPVAPKVIATADDGSAAPKAPAQQKVAVAKVLPKAKTNDAFSPTSPSTAPSTAPAAVGAPTPAAPQPAVPAAPAAKANNGYIAVLASLGSAVDARKTLDELQSRYGEILGGKPTDITEFANPRDGKTYYRAIVGPPQSKEVASSMCAQIKAAGQKECFVAAY